MKKIYLIICVFVLVIIVTIFALWFIDKEEIENNKKFQDGEICMLKITTTWGSYVGVGGNELSGGKRENYVHNIENGDYLDVFFEKNGKNERKYIEILSLNDNDVDIKLNNENINIKYEEEYSIDKGVIPDGPHEIDRIVFYRNNS